jgi:hypothetical protein
VLFRMQLFFLFLLIPFMGAGLAYAQLQPFSAQEIENMSLQDGVFKSEARQLSEQILILNQAIGELSDSTEASSRMISLMQNNAIEELQEYQKQQASMKELIKDSNEQSLVSNDILDYLLVNMLGDPIGQSFGEKATIKVYSLTETGYRGYMAKVRLHSIDALEMILAGTKGETTREAAQRTGAVLAINAGGFFMHEGNMVPIGITVINGEIVTFSGSGTDEVFSFVGFNDEGQLVGGNIESREELIEKRIIHGASFLPTLLKDGEKQPIPPKWANAKQPRTLIGHFKNGDLLFIVIDGRNEGWSDGVTLEEAQRKLLEFNVRDAYNLDGGGSSTFYYQGEVLNRPVGGERKVKTNIIIR